MLLLGGVAVARYVCAACNYTVLCIADRRYQSRHTAIVYYVRTRVKPTDQDSLSLDFEADIIASK